MLDLYEEQTKFKSLFTDNLTISSDLTTWNLSVRWTWFVNKSIWFVERINHQQATQYDLWTWSSTKELLICQSDPVATVLELTAHCLERKNISVLLWLKASEDLEYCMSHIWMTFMVLYWCVFCYLFCHFWNLIISMNWCCMERPMWSFFRKSPLF